MHSVTVIDFETTGLYADNGDRITEIGAIKLRGNKITGVFNSLINPEREIPEFAVAYTGITNEMVANSPTIAQALPVFVEFLQDDVLVMHNAAFDGSFLKYEMKHLGLKKEYEYYCTLKTARKDIKSSNFKLATLKNILNLRTLGTMHRALSDTYITAQLFLKLEKNFGIDTISVMEKDIQRLLNEMESDDLFVMENN